MRAYLMMLMQFVLIFFIKVKAYVVETWHQAMSFTLNLTKVKYFFLIIFLHISSPLPVRNS